MFWAEGLPNPTPGLHVASRSVLKMVTFFSTSQVRPVNQRENKTSSAVCFFQGQIVVELGLLSTAMRFSHWFPRLLSSGQVDSLLRLQKLPRLQSEDTISEAALDTLFPFRPNGTGGCLLAQESGPIPETGGRSSAPEVCWPLQKGDRIVHLTACAETDLQPDGALGSSQSQAD